MRFSLFRMFFLLSWRQHYFECYWCSFPTKPRPTESPGPSEYNSQAASPNTTNYWQQKFSKTFGDFIQDFQASSNYTSAHQSSRDRMKDWKWRTYFAWSERSCTVYHQTNDIKRGRRAIRRFRSRNPNRPRLLHHQNISCVIVIELWTRHRCGKRCTREMIYFMNMYW